jgi:hypothetical protein
MALTDDPNDLGTDINLVTDLAGVWGLALGPTNLINALLRRLSTPRGGLFYDPDYGYDLMSQVNSAITESDIETMNGSIVDELRKDSRVLSVTVGLVFTFATKTLQVTISIETADGPFDLVLAASAVTVELLSINGIAQQATATADTTTVIVGPPGPQGPAGPAGATGGGGGGGTPALAPLDDSRLMVSSTGGEEVLFQWDGTDFGALPAGTLTGELSASVLSGSGTATYRLRIGGSDGVADGTVVATITHALASFLPKNQTGTFTNPSGLQFVKVTAQSSAAAVDAQIKGPVVTFR